MLLSEIVTLPDALQVAKTGIKRSGTLLDSGQQYTIVGTGYESIVFKQQDSPDVIKILTAKKDKVNPYVMYIKLIEKYGKDNPFFPKISQIQSITPSKEDLQDLFSKTQEQKYNAKEPLMFYAFQMEHLTELMSLGSTSCKQLVETLFTEQVTRELKPNFNAINLITTLTEAAIEGPNPFFDSWKDSKNISQARNIIQYISQKTQTPTDLHSQNLMARKTADGYQLVIIDPLYAVTL